MITFVALHAAKRNGTLVAWLAEMTPAERVEAAQVCAANSRRTVSEWLATFGELVEAAALALEERAAQADAAAELAEARTLYEVEPYTLRRANGGTNRTATLVRRGDGKVCRFIEKMSKGEAIRQAAALGEGAWA